MEKSYRPDPITTQERLLDYWFSQLFEQNQKIIELLENKKAPTKPKAKKKEGEA